MCAVHGRVASAMIFITRSPVTLTLICICLCFDIGLGRDLHDHIPQDFEVIIPQVFHDDTHQKIPSSTIFTRSRRKRRSLPSNLYINITTDLDIFHIKLIPNDQLLSPRFKVYDRLHKDSESKSKSDIILDDVTEQFENNDVISSKDDVSDMANCAYKGKVLSHDNAPAAISLCNGVTGVLMFPHDDYVIEPLPTHMTSLQRHKHRHRHSFQQQNENAQSSGKDNGNKENYVNQQRRQHDVKQSHHDVTKHHPSSIDNDNTNPLHHDFRIHDRKEETSATHNYRLSADVDRSNLKLQSPKPDTNKHALDKVLVSNDNFSANSEEYDLKNQYSGHSTYKTMSTENSSTEQETLGERNIQYSVIDDRHSDQADRTEIYENDSELEEGEEEAPRHIMYKRSSLRHHHEGNYETAKDFNKYATSGDSARARSRRKRSSYRSVERSVETLVVVDRDMYRNHGRENVTTYVLSIFNIVSQLYQDASLGYPINVVLVGLVFLDGREPGLHITHHADKTLNSFCQWQAGIHNGRQKLHDHAVLLTGKDICSYQNAPCDTLGFAPIDGMCSEIRSCIVNEDTGLSTAFTVAHEMGHNFGMMHDGDGNICKETSGFIMSPTLAAQSGTFHWSSCSRQYMRNFLNAVQSECLTSQSRGTAELKFPKKQPGEIFDADTQCKWQFGSHSKQCTIMFGRDPCMNLFCHKREGMCETKFLPAAEGTSCGHGMWCQQARCVSYGKKGPPPIDGWWTDWSHWSQCTRTCGGGIKTRTRECNNPRPQYGGKTCPGEETMHKMCNLLDCDPSAPDFREHQCKQLAQHNFRGWNYRWRSYRERPDADAEDQCKLHCKADGYNFYYTMPREVTDGTRCNEYTTDVCVQGQCQRIGCDLIVGSSARKDRCGVCEGDDTSCKILSNTFSQQPRDKTYLGVVYLPRGSSSILIEEVAIAPSNYLALRDANGNYHLNGHWKLDSEGVYPIAGTKFIYRRPYNSPESLAADGPLLEDLVLEVLAQSENPGIKYSFTIPKTQNYIQPVIHNYTWSVVLTECSQECAGGEQTVTAHCHRDQGEEVDPAYCANAQKPGTGTYPCNTQPCRPRWITEPWSVCNKRCGGGKQKRRTHCVQRLSNTEDRKLPRKYCEHVTKPPRKRECNTQECPPVWYKGPWSKCSVTCGKGIKSRTVVCRSKTSEGQIILPVTMCGAQQRPTTQKGCRIERCPDPTAKWTTTSWSQCSSTCGTATQSRSIKCTRQTESKKVIITRDSKCEHLPRLNVTLTQTCDLEPCSIQPKWYASPWSQCSVTCGSGTQTRLVHCMEHQYGRLSNDCDVINKPTDAQTCLRRQCGKPGPDCVDEFSWCHLVPKHNICNHSFYGTKCCFACHSK